MRYDDLGAVAKDVSAEEGANLAFKRELSNTADTAQTFAFQLDRPARPIAVTTGDCDVFKPCLSLNDAETRPNTVPAGVAASRDGSGRRRYGS